MPALSSYRYKQLAFLSFLLLALTLFHPLTLLFAFILIFTSTKYISCVLSKYREKGVMELLPPSIQSQLNRSFFDIMCDIWFVESVSLFKVIIKPLFMPIEPDFAADALNDLPQETKNKLLTKGIIKIMPSFIQKPLLG